MDIFEDVDLLEYEEMDLINYINRKRPYKSRGVFKENFESYSDTEFVQRYRLSKGSVQLLVEQIEHMLASPSDRNYPLPPVQQVLLALRFYATGNFYITIADFAGVCKSTAAKYIKNVTLALGHLRPQFIKLPQNDVDRLLRQMEFHEIARFPRVMGAIDCTHVRIQSPGNHIAETFRNRKGFFSLNVQVVCTATCLIEDIVCRWPGSAHDANIFDNSRIRAMFENNEMGNGLLLGDSAYPQRSYLMTPLPNPQNEAENLYNESQIRTRNVIERLFGIWKRRFPILSFGIRSQLPLAQSVILATAILHNIAQIRQDAMPDGAVPEIHFNDNDLVNNNNNNNQNINEGTRRTIVNYFRQL